MNNRIRQFSLWAAPCVLLTLAGCGNHAPPVPAEAPKSEAVLMVTWLIPGQPPQTTQTVMSSMATCEAARLKAVASGEDAKTERKRQNAEEKAEAHADLERASAQARTMGGFLSKVGPEDERKLRGEPLPQLSAYCVAK